MGNTIILIAYVIGIIFIVVHFYRVHRRLNGTERDSFKMAVKHHRVVRERDALATRVRCQRERLHLLEKADARRAKALEKLVDVAWDVFEFQTDDKGLKRAFAEAFEAYTGKPLGSLGLSAVVEMPEGSAEQEGVPDARDEKLLAELANYLRDTLRRAAPEMWHTHIESAIADAFSFGREGKTKADVVGAPATEEGGGK